MLGLGSGFDVEVRVGGWGQGSPGWSARRARVRSLRPPGSRLGLRVGGLGLGLMVDGLGLGRMVDGLGLGLMVDGFG